MKNIQTKDRMEYVKTFEGFLNESNLNEGLKAAMDINIEDAKSIFKQLKNKADKGEIGLGDAASSMLRDLKNMLKYKSCTLINVDSILGTDNEILFGTIVVDPTEREDFGKTYAGQGPYILATWSNGELTNVRLVEAWKWNRSKMNKQKQSWFNSAKEILK
jgi:hypothetical protein